jgi:hypothetical protein
LSLSGEDPVAAPKVARQAIEEHERLGLHPALQARAWLVLAHTEVALERPRASAEAAQRALVLARRCGDLSSEGGALNLLTWFEPDQARVLRLFQQALAAYTRADNTHGRAIVIGNLGANCAQVGLFRRGRRLLREADAAHRRSGNVGALAINCVNLFEAELRLGRASSASPACPHGCRRG